MSHRIRLASISRSSSETLLNWTPDTLTESTCGAIALGMPELELLAGLIENPIVPIGRMDPVVRRSG